MEIKSIYARKEDIWGLTLEKGSIKRISTAI